MFTKEKTQLTNLKKVEKFRDIIKRITLDQLINEEEQSYILSCAIIFYKYFESDKRYTSYLEFAYYIILKYSIKYNDYLPLYDFSLNFGYYPIAKNIMLNKLLEDLNLNDYLINMQIEKYKNGNYIETYEQKNIRNTLLTDNKSTEISYIAPTSYGKSSIIIDHILKIQKEKKKFGIIVPTKSLLLQTYRMVRNSDINKKIIMHDKMYTDEENFIAILTQERALRLLQDNDVFFDVLYIDEAHNLLKKDSRSILLSRLIRKNFSLNPSHNIIYLSPLISDTNNLKIYTKQEINEKRINYNLKEPEYYEYRLNGNYFKYNRFTNEFYEISRKENILSYINYMKSDKNFIYIRSPRKIELFTKKLFNNLPTIRISNEIMKLIEELKDYVHEDFYLLKYLEKGIIYLHGKMPDLIKEYLESKYKELNELNFIVANSVILEGMNLPINTLFILNIYNLQGKELTNLIGRVNRLNNIFTSKINNLPKLLPQVHFINSEVFNRKGSNMSKKIEKLRSRIFEDKIENPVLESFDFSKLKISKNEEDKQREKYEYIKDKEEFILSNKNFNEGIKEFHKKILQEGIDEVYGSDFNGYENILGMIKELNTESSEWRSKNIIEKIYFVFIKDINQIVDFEVSRLKNQEARNYYKMHIKNSQINSLKENINLMYNYFKLKIKKGDALFYIGQSYGEIQKDTNIYSGTGAKVYIDLTTKSDKELINLIIIKLKMEDNFISFKLNKFVNVMFLYELITEDEYNIWIVNLFQHTFFSDINIPYSTGVR